MFLSYTSLMFPVPGKPRVERSKTPEQIRDEAVKATAADMAALYDTLAIAPNDEVKLQVAAQLFWRHRDEIQAEATSVHFCPEDAPCDAPADDGSEKITH